MQLREALVFSGAKQPKLEVEIGEEESAEDRITLGLKGPLTLSIARSLGIEWVFVTETIAHGGIENAQLDKNTAFEDTVLRLVGQNGELDNFFPEKVYAFRVFKVGGGGLGVQCKIDVTGSFDSLLDFFRRHRDGFTYSIQPRQTEMFAGGERVDVSPNLSGDSWLAVLMPAGSGALVDVSPNLSGDGWNRPSDQPEPVKRGRGRPAGSKNKKTGVPENKMSAAEMDRILTEEEGDGEIELPEPLVQ